MLKGWEQKDQALEKLFEFPGFKKTMLFVNAVAAEATRQKHHPEMIVNFKTCLIRITTHDAGNTITEKDYKLAEAIDQISL
ncbi:MAG: 4a-hydroxytetrahydrobiopterin dehydratase [Bacteriovoracaceae bacterium]|nr:4a-hydroxytetrahydrobiopterin dehydratase [Bacteriovoracaceae bacterium]